MAEPEGGWHVTPRQARATEPTPGRASALLMQYGAMTLRYYAPRGRDSQSPHEQDELYVVLSGRGTYVRNGARTTFGPGDVLFAAAGDEHRFEDFTEDFETWVVFYGPNGGEGR